jgi:Tfp pilus assembly protein PilV
MTAPGTNNASRGSTLLEVLMAGAILVIGLTGVVTMMLRTSAGTRDGANGFNAAAYGASTLQELTALGFQNLTVTGTLDSGVSLLDAGIVYDSSGRRYGRLVSVTAGGTSAFPTYNVAVQVEWRDAAGQPRVTSTSTIIGRAPDAG